MAEFLRRRFGDRVELRASSLEDVELEADFDLAVAASSFHWIDEDAGLARLRDALRPGGFVALWWTVFGDRTRNDPFWEAVEPLTRELPRARPKPRQAGRASLSMAKRAWRRSSAPVSRTSSRTGSRG
jgi:trans-aconitate methyltransferase